MTTSPILPIRIGLTTACLVPHVLYRFSAVSMAVLISLLLLTFTVDAQTPPNATVSPAPSPSVSASPKPSASGSPAEPVKPAEQQPGPVDPSPAPPDLSTAKVTRVQGTLALFNNITVTVENLPVVLRAVNNDLSKIILYIDGYPLKGIKPRKGDQPNDLDFVLRRTDVKETKDSWNSLLGRPSLPIPRQEDKSVTIGVEGQAPLEVKFDGKANPEGDPRSYPMTIINPYGYWVFVVVLVLFLVLFVRWARSTDVLRIGPKLPNGKLQRYSLGRCQMAYWFCIVAASYVFIWMVTSEYSVLPGSVLALIGISAATALGAELIDVSGPRGVADSVAVQPTDGFFTDIFTDDQGKLTFHRFQIVVWSVILAVIFVASVYNVLAMADFPNELLALMGISSGTYIGFKFPEKQDAQNRVEAEGGASANSPRERIIRANLANPDPVSPDNIPD